MLANLHQRLRHENLAFKLRVHRKERGAVEFLECAYEHNLDVFDGEEIEMTQIKLCCASVDEQLVVNFLKVSLAVMQFYGTFRFGLLNWVVFLRAHAFVEHSDIVGFQFGCDEVFGFISFCA